MFLIGLVASSTLQVHTWTGSKRLLEKKSRVIPKNPKIVQFFISQISMEILNASFFISVVNFNASRFVHVDMYI